MFIEQQGLISTKALAEILAAPAAGVGESNSRHGPAGAQANGGPRAGGRWRGPVTQGAPANRTTGLSSLLSTRSLQYVQGMA
jgi:hypothetical protein